MSSALVTATISLSLHITDAAASIGKITEQSGPTEIKRGAESTPSDVNTPVQANDTVITAKAKAGITFEDETKVQITEHSKLVIDSFVYDPASKNSAGKLGMKVALGTVRYASGQIAKNNPQSVNIETPTASIGVRGTDFSMTVDEIGRSLIVLLPSCPVGYKNVDKDCKTGAIEVTTAMGTVLLNKPFQSTYTMAKEGSPLKPRILDLTESQINNMLILTKVKEKDAEKTDDQEEKKKWWQTDLEKNYLEQDFFNKSNKVLTIDYLEYNKLGRNFLESDFLSDYLNAAADMLKEDYLKESTGVLPGYNPASGLRYSVDGDKITLFNIQSPHPAEVTVSMDSNATILFIQNGITIKQNVNGGSTSNITVIQK
jgi:hypothetical protein